MGSRIEYYGKSGQHLKYSVCKTDGTPKGAPLHPLPESQTPGYYTTISHTNLEKDDKVVIYGPENVLYEVEPLTYEGNFIIVDETVGKGEFSSETQAPAVEQKDAGTNKARNNITLQTKEQNGELVEFAKQADTKLLTTDKAALWKWYQYFKNNPKAQYVALANAFSSIVEQLTFLQKMGEFTPAQTKQFSIAIHQAYNWLTQLRLSIDGGPPPPDLIQYINQTLKMVESSTKTDESQNFIREGSVWQICFDGQPVFIYGSLRGLPLIAYLLRNPHKPISALDLEKAVAKIPAGKAVSMSELTGDLKDDENCKLGLTITNTGGTINARHLAKADAEELKAAIAHLKQKRDGTENTSTKDLLDDQIETLKEELDRKTNKRGRARPIGSDPYEKARVRVTQKIDRIKRILKNDHKKLHDHLDLCLKIGAECSYTPENPPNWHFF